MSSLLYFVKLCESSLVFDTSWLLTALVNTDVPSEFYVHVPEFY